MLQEYDFSNAVRGKYAARYAKGTNIVVLEPDVAKVFSNSKLVNETLRACLSLKNVGRRAVVKITRQTKKQSITQH